MYNIYTSCILLLKNVTIPGLPYSGIFFFYMLAFLFLFHQTSSYLDSYYILHNRVVNNFHKHRIVVFWVPTKTIVEIFSHNFITKSDDNR